MSLAISMHAPLIATRLTSTKTGKFISGRESTKFFTAVMFVSALLKMPSWLNEITFMPGRFAMADKWGKTLWHG